MAQKKWELKKDDFLLAKEYLRDNLGVLIGNLEQGKIFICQMQDEEIKKMRSAIRMKKTRKKEYKTKKQKISLCVDISTHKEIKELCENHQIEINQALKAIAEYFNDQSLVQQKQQLERYLD